MNLTSALSVFLFASSGAELPLPTKVPGMARDTLIVLIAASAVGLVLLGVLTLWVKTRRSRRHHHRHHRQTHSRSESKPTAPRPAEPDQAETGADPDTGPDTESGTSRHRRRKRRREHRPRNPTLAETGGLPPPRPEGQVPPGP